MERRGAEGRGTKVKGCEERVGGRRVRRYVVEVDSRGGTGGEEKRICGVEGEGGYGGLDLWRGTIS